MTLTRLEPTDPHESVMRLALGHVAARTVHAFAHLRVADHLAAGACTPLRGIAASATVSIIESAPA